MREASRALIVVGLGCAGIGIVFHNGLVAVGGVALLLLALLVRLLIPQQRTSGGYARPKFGPTTVASTISGDAGRPIDFTPRD